VTVSVGEERQLGQILHRREDVVDHGVPNDHLVERVLVLAEVRGHAFHDPERSAGAEGAAEVALVEDRELEDVRQLVGDERVQLVGRLVDREHHAVLDRLRERPDLLADLAERDVRLLELGVRLVDDHRHAEPELVVELLADPQVRALGVRDDVLEERLLLV
jgi:hypothetical protein